MKYLIVGGLLVLTACAASYTDNQENQIYELTELLEDASELLTGYEDANSKMQSIIAAQQKYILHLENACGHSI